MIKLSPYELIRALLVLTLPLAHGSCGGGGGGGSAPDPISSPVSLTQAVFEGQTPSDTTPDPGDKLILIFSGDISLVATKLLDSADLDISTGSTAGSVGGQSAPPLKTTGRSIEITLGSGTSFTPDTSTLTLKDVQDAIADSGGDLIAASAAVTIKNSDGDNPSIDLLTLNAVPVEINGTGAAAGLLQMPTTGFTIDLDYSDPSSPLDTSTLVLTNTVDVQQNGVAVLAGTNLTPLLVSSMDAGSASLQVPGTILFPLGSQVLTASISDITGNLSPTQNFTFTVTTATTALRPLENGQLWYIDLDRDIETLRSTSNDGGLTITFPVDNLPILNGTPDFSEALLILGLHSPTPISDVTPGKDSNQVTLELLQAEILVQLGLLFANTTVDFTFTAPGSFPAGMASTSYAASGFSQISLGGSSDVAALGVAQFDPNNSRQEDDTLHPNSTPAAAYRLGVFPHTLTANGVNLPGSYFRNTFDPILDHRGLPIGEDPSDDIRLQSLLVAGAGDARQEQFDVAIKRFARLLAVTLAHECGHSMGLVQDARPPVGLFGGDSYFPGSSSGHLNLSNTSIFPFGAQEVMAPAISFQGSNHASTGFNPLFKAYLRETLLYGQ